MFPPFRIHSVFFLWNYNLNFSIRLLEGKETFGVSNLLMVERRKAERKRGKPPKREEEEGGREISRAGVPCISKVASVGTVHTTLLPREAT